MKHFVFFLADSLQKVFPDERPKRLASPPLSGLIGERLSLQLVYFAEPSEDYIKRTFRVVVAGAAESSVRIRSVELMPCELPYIVKDADYLRSSPGLYPDLLAPCSGLIVPLPGQYRSLWIDFPLNVAGDFSLEISVLPLCEDGSSGTAEFTATVPVHVIPTPLPRQELLHTEWFHADCLADFYGVEVFSEVHWDILDKFIAFAGEEAGINLLLTPVFTPPLDTAVGGERTSIQLVDAEKTDAGYEFDFSKLERWCALCKKHGIQNLEISHLYTQWGAGFAPKIAVRENGVKKDLFGWHTPASSPEYLKFLRAFIPRLIGFLYSCGYKRKNLFFHISDEPTGEQLQSYLAAKLQVEELLSGCSVTDALSNFDFYSQGAVEHPIVATDHLAPFIEAGVHDLWAYYCVSQYREVPNRFFSMPSARNRIMGVLLWLYDISGFLHWGFNFYNTQLSLEHIDPFRVTDAGRAFPSGDPFLVYPGKNGAPLSSLRNEVQMQGLYDLRALRLLEKLAGRSFTQQLVCSLAGGTPDFKNYPRGSDGELFLFELRRRVNSEIENRLS